MNDQAIASGPIIQMVQQLWWLFPLIIAAKLIEHFAPHIKGKVGEGLVNLGTKIRLDPKLYHRINDVTIPTKRGTTQIDHIIVSKFGIFVIETKNYKGWIFADAKSSKWTQVQFKQKNQFQNPLRQNHAHICALAELLGLPKQKFHGIVCFMGDAKFKKGIPKGVFLDGSYLKYIEAFYDEILTGDEVSALTQTIESGRLERGFKTNRVHVKQLKSRHSSGGTPPSEKNDSAAHHSAKLSARNAERK